MKCLEFSWESESKWKEKKRKIINNLIYNFIDGEGDSLCRAGEGLLSEEWFAPETQGYLNLSI